MNKPQLSSSRIIILIISLLLSGFSFFTPTWERIERQIHKEFPQVKHIGVEELSRIMDGETLLLIDVRDAEEFAVSQIKGAKNIQSPAQVDTDKQTRIIVYCSVGYRSANFAQDLQEMGFRNVYNLRGSIFAWANHGYPLYQNDQRTFHVHPFNEKWVLAEPRQAVPRNAQPSNASHFHAPARIYIQSKILISSYPVGQVSVSRHLMSRLMASSFSFCASARTSSPIRHTPVRYGGFFSTAIR